MDERLDPALVDRARLRNNGVGFSLFKQLNIFIELTLSRVSLSKILHNSASSLVILEELVAKSFFKKFNLSVRLAFSILSIFFTQD
jgi:hypothetical protein